MLSNNPSVIGTLASQCPADSSPYTGEPTAAAGLLNGISLFGTTCLAGGFRLTKTSSPQKVCGELIYSNFSKDQ